MSFDWYKESHRLEQKNDNLRKARDLVYSFPEHEYLRLVIPNGLEIEVRVYGLSVEEKIEKVYNSLNNYIEV